MAEKPRYGLSLANLADASTQQFFPIPVSTVKPVDNCQPWAPKIVAVVDRWSLFRGRVY